MIDEMVRRALAVNAANLALGNEVFGAGGATFVRNASAPSIRDANHVASVTASTPAEIDALLALAEREFAGYPHRRFDCDALTPPEFEARLALEGYRRDEALVMLLEGDLHAPPIAHEVTPIDNDASWEALLALHAANWKEHRDRDGLPEAAEVGQAMSRMHRAKCPPVRYWLGWIDGAPRGYFNSWAGIDGMGQVEDLFVLPEYRKRGLATSLVRHCVDDCRAQGAGPVVIVADPTDTPKLIYARMGFRPVAIERDYWLDLTGKGN